MVVQHNLTAMNSNRMLGITTKAQAKATEKLSSGYKINRAADDAAGLAISEKMRKQIRGLTQASLNAQDGISAVQTAEGALTEVHDMIQRMNELAVKSANGTNSKEERDYIQLEIDQLSEEIDRVAETTKFSDIYLLKGEDTGTQKVEVAYNNDITGEKKLVYNTASAGTVYATLDGESEKLTEDNFAKYFELDKNGAATSIAGVKFYSVAPVNNTEFGAQTANVASAITVDDYVTVDTDLLKDKDGKAVEENDIKAGGSYFDADGSYKGGLWRLNKDGDLTEIGAEQIDDYVKVDRRAVTSDLTLSLHVGAEGSDVNKIDITIKSMDSESIKVKGLKVDTKDDATAAIDKLNDALKIVSEQRALLGAAQNRLEHTINNLDNVVENTTAAESQIRDTDMATQMVQYANNQILAQAGQAMLAQSNQANQGVLSLLQ